MLTVKQAADRMGISPSLVYALCRDGVIRCTRHGRPGKRGTIRISDEALAAYVADCMREGEPVLAGSLPLKHIS